MKPLKTKVSMTLDNDLVTVIRELAEEDDRSFSQYVNLILKEWITAKNQSTEKKTALYNRANYSDSY